MRTRVPTIVVAVFALALLADGCVEAAEFEEDPEPEAGSDASGEGTADGTAVGNADAAGPDPGPACEHQAPCDDGNPCTLGDVCLLEVCSGTFKECEDDDVCTAGMCNEETGGCEFEPAPNGTPCFDGDPCVTGDTCNAGDCVSGTGTHACNDGIPCTEDGCEIGKGCTVTANDAVCGAQGPCGTPKCYLEEGCVIEPENELDPCDSDEDGCTFDRCQEGVCNSPLPAVDAAPGALLLDVVGLDDGSSIAVGGTEDGQSTSDALAVHISTTGQREIWALGQGAGASALAVITDSSGQVVTCGVRVEDGTERAFVAGLVVDEEVSVGWSAAHPDDSSLPSRCTGVVEREGGYALVGTTSQGSTGPSDLWLQLVDSSGAAVGESLLFGGDGEEWGVGLVGTDDGGFLLAGNVRASAEEPADARITLVDGAGVEVWTELHGSEVSEQRVTDLVALAAGGWAFSGIAQKATNPNAALDAWLLVVDEEGKLSFDENYPSGFDAAALTIVVDEAGDYVLGGHKSISAASPSRWWLLVADKKKGQMLSSEDGSTLQASWIEALAWRVDGGLVAAGRTEGVDGLLALADAKDGLCEGE